MKESLLKGVYGDLSPEEVNLKKIQNTERLKRGALGSMTEDEIEARRYGTLEILHGKDGLKNGSEQEINQQKETFKDIYSGFQGDIEVIRKAIAECNNLSDERLKQVKREEILQWSETVKKHIAGQINNEMTDPQEKGMFANLEDELAVIIKSLG